MIADDLSAIAALFPDVAIGSYPRMQPDEDGHRVLLTLEGKNQAGSVCRGPARVASLRTYSACIRDHVPLSLQQRDKPATRSRQNDCGKRFPHTNVQNETALAALPHRFGENVREAKLPTFLRKTARVACLPTSFLRKNMRGKLAANLVLRKKTARVACLPTSFCAKHARVTCLPACFCATWRAWQRPHPLDRSNRCGQRFAATRTFFCDGTFCWLAQDSGLDSRPAKILIVEDEEKMARLLRRGLRRRASGRCLCLGR